ncbi:unnamed protein product [Closterium sp. NIES-65]|nr:unnamed protein product [Closterium sp. NIES-65]
MICPFMLTADGHENQFGTNHAGKCREATTWADRTTPPLPPSPPFFRPSAPPPPLFPFTLFPPSPAHTPHPIASHVVPPLGHFLLTNLLLPKLKETAKQEGAEARIVIVSSAAHQFPYPGGIRFDAINAKEGYDSVRAYGQSKLANILHARELARRLKVHGCLTVNALYPWVIDPSTMEKPPASLANTLHHPPSSPLSPSLLSLDPCEQEEGAGVTGAATSCFLAAHPSVAGASGGYYADARAAEGKATVLSKDMEQAGKLWELSEQMANKE